ncbi:MAG: ribosome assembly cofactor RimP [Lewinellaceae bacterium]|nr:ribosome assembly cofactor RimP [Phaeodactylibacter sp.]MCB9266296.1 ribosome assembly cofactor RimP [Lewinellaceae bacterium]
MVESKIESLLEAKFQEEGFTDCFLIELKLHANNKLDVFIDTDNGVTFEKCQQISRYLEEFLDEEGWLGENYVLEVSSPGISRPLKLRRQYPRNIGRKVEVSLAGGKNKEGTLVAVGEEEITIEEKIRVKEGKRRKVQVLQTRIPFEDIKKTVVKISF